MYQKILRCNLWTLLTFAKKTADIFPLSNMTGLYRQSLLLGENLRAVRDIAKNQESLHMGRHDEH